MLFIVRQILLANIHYLMLIPVWNPLVLTLIVFTLCYFLKCPSLELKMCIEMNFIMSEMCWVGKFLFYEKKLNKSQSLLSGKCLASHYHHQQTKRGERYREWMSAFALCKYINKNISIFLPYIRECENCARGWMMIQNTLARHTAKRAMWELRGILLKGYSVNPSSTSSSFECHHFQFSNPRTFSMPTKSFPCEKLLWLSSD